MTMFWDRQGQPIEGGEGSGVLIWAKMFEDSEYRIVAVDQDAPDTPMVSTIWQGLDLNHSLNPFAIPAIFETVHMHAEKPGDDATIDDRIFTPTEESALDAHAEFCRMYLNREPLPGGGLKAEIIRREKGED